MTAESTELRHRDAPADRTLVHSGIVRITHWMLVVSFVSLVVSGIAILIVHPRLYWGETGAWGTPSLIDLPLPYVRDQSGWGRYLHFLAAWVCVLSGLTYVVAGIVNRHFRADLVPPKAELTGPAIFAVLHDHLRWRRPVGPDAWRYNVVQRLTYLVVIFVLFPAMVWTGLAMSPTITAAYPFIVMVLGGHQTARTLHFVVANLLFLFLLVHLAMLGLVGFGTHVRAMITGHRPARSSET